MTNSVLLSDLLIFILTSNLIFLKVSKYIFLAPEDLRINKSRILSMVLNFCAKSSQRETGVRKKRKIIWKRCALVVVCQKVLLFQ